MPDQPDADSGYVVIFHRRRAFCLEIKPGAGPLSTLQRASHAKLQDAGIPVEVARSLADVRRALRQFDIPQKEVA